MGVRPTEMGNNRIRKSGFVNQNSLLGALFEKVFLTLSAKIVLQQIRVKSRRSVTRIALGSGLEMAATFVG